MARVSSVRWIGSADFSEPEPGWLELPCPWVLWAYGEIKDEDELEELPFLF